MPLRFIENIILNVFPGDEGLQEVPPMHRVLKYLRTSNPIHCSSLHGQLSAGVEERGGVDGVIAKKCVCACVCMCVSVWGELTSPSFGFKDQNPYQSISPLPSITLVGHPLPAPSPDAESLWTPASPNEDLWLHFHFWSHIRDCQAQNRPVSSEAQRAG